ncbi:MULTISPECIES: SdpI family protein [Salinibaculum]|uniref:SdpI family protein n=1 Tax=Salinibaculum TaxID=2732368 RepID=UPI0030CEF2AB
MSPTRRTLVGLGIVLLTGVASVVVYPDLPEQMAIHFDGSGQPDDYLTKPLAAALMPVLGLLVVGLFAAIPRLDPLGENFAEFERYYDLVAVVTVGILAYVHALVLGYNLGYRFDVAQVLAPVLSVVAVTFGYVVENARQNWFVGIRTPWTLSSETVWTRTNERSGVLFKLAGLVALLAVPFPEYFTALAIAPLALAALIPTAYSYVLYRRLETA